MNYNIENGLNFYDILKQSIAVNESEKNEEVCLISNTPFEERFFTFECGHKFNYGPLFKDIYNHKKKYNHMEHHKEHLYMNEIRCPFCRKKQSGVLPYYSELPFDKVHGVNYINPSIIEYTNQSSGSNFKKCQFKITSETDGSITLCSSIGNVMTADSSFCYLHYMQYKQVEKKKAKAIKDAEKLAKKIAEKEAKLAQKVAEKEAKLAQKVAEKEAKLAQKVAEKEAKLAQKVAEKEAKLAQKVAEKAEKMSKK